MNLTELSVYSKKGEERETNPTKNYYYSLDFKRIASMDPSKSHDYLIMFYISVKSMIVFDPEVKVVIEWLTTLKNFKFTSTPWELRKLSQRARVTTPVLNYKAFLFQSTWVSEMNRIFAKWNLGGFDPNPH